MFNIQDFKIISTEYDSLLFFNSNYQNAVLRAINKIMDRVDFDITSKILQLICHDKYIIIRDKKDEPTIYEIAVLNHYEPTKDTKNFTLAII